MSKRDKFEFLYKGFTASIIPTMIIEYNDKTTFKNLKTISKFARAFAKEDEAVIRVTLYSNGVYAGYMDCLPACSCDIYFTVNGRAFEVWHN